MVEWDQGCKQAFESSCGLWRRLLSLPHSCCERHPPPSGEKSLIPGAMCHSSLLYQQSIQGGWNQDKSSGTHRQVGGTGIHEHRKTSGILHESHMGKERKRRLCGDCSLGCEGQHRLVKEEGVREGVHCRQRAGRVQTSRLG